MRRKANPSTAYSGFIKFPLTGAEDGQRDVLEFYGDFNNPRRRERIFRKPRKYRMEIWVRLKDPDEYDVMHIAAESIEATKIAEVLYGLGTQVVSELGAENIDFKNSFFKVKL